MKRSQRLVEFVVHLKVHLSVVQRLTKHDTKLGRWTLCHAAVRADFCCLVVELLDREIFKFLDLVLLLNEFLVGLGDLVAFVLVGVEHILLVELVSLLHYGWI